MPIKDRYFNSRTHVECDEAVASGNADQINFNSRTHVECDYCNSLPMVILCRFQLTHSRGVRLDVVVLIIVQLNFNSRTHVECDASFFASAHACFNFNSRTHVECDHEKNGHQQKEMISTHALTWSATNSNFENAENAKFQLTHSRGVRRTLFSDCAVNRVFQLTHSRGVRPSAN